MDIRCTVLEKKSYPFHRVCGEYVSNETKPFLKRSQLFPDMFSPPEINRFTMSSPTGNTATTRLGMGGFGISRFVFDDFLHRKALAEGVEFYLNTEADSIQFVEEKFHVSTPERIFEADLVIGAFGKRSKLDMALDRSFTRRRSPYAAVKYHIRTDHPSDLIALHNFRGGYCGVSAVEGGSTNVCYLVHRDLIRKAGSIQALEQEHLLKNPRLNELWRNAEFLFPRPEVINEISFETKGPVEDHVLFAGDAAGMIAPLCGNGMSMAIHSGVILSDLASAFCRNAITRSQLEKNYRAQWNKLFRNRLWYGRNVQKMFGHPLSSGMLVSILRNLPALAHVLISQSHGRVF